jgi:hypothetical protein
MSFLVQDANFIPILCVKTYPSIVKYCNPIVPATLVHAGGGSLAKDRVAKFQLAWKKKLFNPKLPTP